MWVTSINIVSSKEREEKEIVEHLQEFVPAQKGILRRLFKHCFLLWYIPEPTPGVNLFSEMLFSRMCFF